MKYLFSLTIISIVILHSFSFSQEENEVEMVVAEGVEIDSSLISPEAEEAYNNGVVAFQNDNFTEAITLFTTAINLHEDFEKAYSNRAYCYLSNNDLANAKNDFLKLSEISENPANAYYEIGAINSAEGNGDEAIAFYQKAIESNSSEPKYHYQKGLENFKKENYQNP